MDDISQQTSVPDPSPPDQAAKNINNANLFGVDPSAYKSYAPTLDSKADEIMRPKSATPAVADFMKQSSEHTALATPDVEHLSFMEKAAKYAGDIVYNRPTDEQRLIRLSIKKMDKPDEFTPDDDIQLQTLRMDIGEQAKNNNYGQEPPSIPEQIGTALAETGRTVRRNADLIGAFTGGGALLGSVLPGPGTLAGAGTGFGLGVASAFAVDAYDSSRGSTYNELSQMTKEDGSPLNIDETTKRQISNGLGVVSAALMGTVGAAVTKTTPFMSKFVSPGLAKNLILNPTNAAIAKAVTNIGEAVMVGGSASALMEYSHIIAQEMGANYDGTESSFLQALQTASSKIETLKRSAVAGVVGGATAGILSVGTNLAGLKGMRDEFQRRRDSITIPPVRDVTPGATPELGPGKPTLGEQTRYWNPDLGPQPSEPSGPLKLLGQGNQGERNVKDSIDVLHMQDAIESMNHASEQTKMNEVAPDQMSILKAAQFAKAGFEKIWLLKDDLRGLAHSPEKGAEVRELLGGPGVDSAAMNAPIEVDPAKFANFIMKNPEASDLARQKPNGPSAGQAREWLTKLQDADAEQRKVILSLGLTPDLELTPKEPSNVVPMPEAPKGESVPFDVEGKVRRADELLKTIADEKTTPANQTKAQTELDQIKTQVQEHYRLKHHIAPLLIGPWEDTREQKANAAESAFMDTDIYPQAFTDIIPEKERTKFTDAVKGGKAAIQDDVNFALNHEMTKVSDLVEISAKEVAYEEELARIEDDPHYKLVDRFRNYNDKGKPVQSLYAIDPKTLRDDQLRWLDHPRLKEHKVWAKAGTGLTPDQAASLVGGVLDGDDLLKTLAATPLRKEIVHARVEFGKIQRARESKESVDLNWQSKLTTYDNRAKLATVLMRHMLGKEWPTTKKAIKRIAFPPPQPKQMSHDARQMVLKTKVKDLDVAKWVVGERKSRKLGVEMILKTEPEKAFLALEAQAKNILMQKHTLIAIGEVNKAFNFIAGLSSKKGKTVFANAGKLYINARDEILDVFNLDPSKKGTSERDAYAKFVQNKLRKGEGDFSIPPQFLDVRKSVYDMPVEQLLAITDRLRALYALARLKNRLLQKKFKEEQEIKMSDVRDTVERLLKAHRGYDSNKIPPVQKSDDSWRDMGNHVRAFESLFTNMEHVLRQLDEQKLAGYFQELLYHAIKGDGMFDKKSGYSRELEMTLAFKNHIEALVEKYGKKDFKGIENDWIDVPEFKGISEIRLSGRVTRAELMVLWAFGGDPYLKEKRLNNNGGISHEVMQKVFDRELTDRDVDFMQGMIDMFKDYRAETAALQKRTNGMEVTFVEGIPNRFKDRWLSGGYLPAKYITDYTKEGADAALRALKKKGAALLGSGDIRQFAAEQTEQGRLISRTNSTAALDLSMTRLMRGHEEVIHDLCYREACIDALKILRDKSIRKNIMAVVGKSKYDMLVSTVIEIATKAEAENISYFSDQNRLFKATMGHFQNNFNVVVLGFNPTSTAIQLESMTQVVQNMGTTGPKHLALTNARIMRRLDLLPGFYHFAAELDPTIGHWIEQLQNKLVSNVMEMAPKRGVHHMIDPLKLAHEWAVKTAMQPMQLMDVFIKIQSALASYSQFMAGDVENFPLDKIMAMDDEVRHKAAQAYVRQISRLSLTHGRAEDKAPFQKFSGAGLLANYWNDARNVVNNFYSQGRRASWELKDISAAIGSGGAGGAMPPNGPPSGSQGGAGGAMPPNGPPGGANPKDYSRGLSGAKGAAGIILGTMFLAAMGRMYSDWLRDHQETPIDHPMLWRNAKDLEANAKYLTSYLLTAAPDQLFSTHPYTRTILWAAQNKWEKSNQKRVEIPFTKELSDIATSVSYLIDYVDSQAAPSNAQRTALLKSQSYLIFPLPINGVKKINKWLDEGQMKRIQNSRADDLRKSIDNWKEYHGSNPDNKEFLDALINLDGILHPSGAKEH